MNKKFITLLMGAVATLALTSCGTTQTKEYDFNGSGYTDCDYIAIKHVLINLSAGKEQKIEVESYPTNYSASSLKYESSNESVATVSAKGVVKGVAQGVTDIVVSTKDGSFSNKVRVVVSKKSSATGVAGAIENINAVYDDPGYQKPGKVIRYEYSAERYYCEGVVDHGIESYEVMGFDTETGYFFVDGPSVYFKTPHGAPEVKDGKWIFYPINYGLETRIIHVSPTAKHFIDINTANYEDYADIIKDIMNFWFVSGEDILNNMLDNFDGKELLNDLATDNATSFYAVNDNTVFLNNSGSDTDYTVDADDEINYFDIPAGTKYDIKVKEGVLNQNGRTTGMDIEYLMDYKLNGKKWQREFVRSQLYDDDFVVEKVQDPEHNGYTRVDTVYDL